MVTFPATDAQRAIIELPVDASAILIKAGPGSGKTRVLCDRIVHLLEAGVDPRQITAVTFTQLAAHELRQRIQARAEVDVWTGTFHGYAYRVLQAHGANWGFPRPIQVLDEVGQLAALRNAFTTVTGYRGDEYKARELAQIISLRKRRGQTIEEYDYSQIVALEFEERLREIDSVYHEFLRGEPAFDYDELIYQVNLHLRTDDAARAVVQREARWLLVDEFQDVSDDQYALIEVVAPARLEDRYLFAVGDERQSIYRFRGAGSEKLFTRLRLDYRAREIGLNENFRSTESIVRAANLIQPPDANTRLVSVSREASRPIHIYAFGSVEDEANRVRQIVQQRIEAGDEPDSIAILYSTHRRANAVESALSDARLPVYRHVRNSIHTRPEAEPLIALMRDADVPIRRDGVLRTIGLLPAALVDEFDWIRQERARTDGGEFAPTLGLDHRLRTLGECVKLAKPPKTPNGVGRYANRLLDFYAPILDLIDDTERAQLLDLLTYIDRYVTDALLAVQAALDAGHEIVLLTGDSHDGYLARALLQDLLPDGDPQLGQFYLCLGCEVPAGVRGFRIDPEYDPTVMVTVTMQAWRLAQRLLPGERLDGFSYVAIDLETTSTNVATTDIIELGAVRFDPATGEILDRFTSLIHCRKLPGTIAQLTGITATELYEAPKAADVLQRFIVWLRPDDILIGHNVAEFDLDVLNRHCIASSLGAIDQPSIDTLKWSRRLLPHLSAKLEHLMVDLPLTARPSHRALPDAESTAELFCRLLEERDRFMRVRALDGALPLVAASLLEYPNWDAGDGALLVELGGRRLMLGAAGKFVVRARQALGLQWTSLGKELLRRKRVTSRRETTWLDFRKAWIELIERHAAMMPTLTAVELATSLALSATNDAGILPGNVTMMTIHAAKGKEWPTVIMIGAEDDQFPSRTTPDPEEIEEGGRLFYVGITRAKTRLMITWAAERNGNQKRPSRYLELIPKNDEGLAIRRRY
ncbi:MAG: UvrD-helicase domain-containing protein [Thermomicrobiales bacterium]|nr:UvrD-helicase domain-containing protein [Thermomicrobiales bacterium]